MLNFVCCDYFGWRRSVLIIWVRRRASFAASVGGPGRFRRRGWGCRGLRFLFRVFGIFHQLVLLGAAVVAQRVVFIQVFLVSASLKSHEQNRGTLTLQAKRRCKYQKCKRVNQLHFISTVYKVIFLLYIVIFFLLFLNVLSTYNPWFGKFFRSFSEMNFIFLILNIIYKLIMKNSVLNIQSGFLL